MRARNERSAHPSSSWRAAPAGTSFRRWRSRACCARVVEVIWLGTQRGLEARIVPAAGIPIEWLSVGGLRGKGVLTLLAAPFRLVTALWQALRRHVAASPASSWSASAALSPGPGGVAAWLTRRPLVIHEQNAVAGFTNRCLSHLAREVLEAFPGSFGARRRCARDRQSCARAISAPCRRRQSDSLPASGAIRILVIGGSQGAARLNAVVPFALAKLAGLDDLRCTAPGRRALDRGRRAELCRCRRAGGRAPVHRGYGARLTAGPIS